MSLASRLPGRLWKLPRPLVRDVAAEPLRIPMRDGTALRADRYYSRRQPRQPTLLIGTCYGRGTLFGALAALFAERGMPVVAPSCRGSAGSQGRFHGGAIPATGESQNLLIEWHNVEDRPRMNPPA